MHILCIVSVAVSLEAGVRIAKLCSVQVVSRSIILSCKLDGVWDDSL